MILALDNETDGGVRDGERRDGRRQIDELERRSFARMRGCVPGGAVSIKAHIFVGMLSHKLTAGGAEAVGEVHSPPNWLLKQHATLAARLQDISVAPKARVCFRRDKSLIRLRAQRVGLQLTTFTF